MNKSGTQPPSCRLKLAHSTSTDTASTTTTAVSSPHHRRALSAIPFSWEQHPGIAKPTIQTKASSSEKYIPKSRLPRPPPMSLSHIPICPTKRRSSASFMTADPFELALAECAKAPPTPPGLMEEIWGRKMVEPQRTKWRFGLGVHSRCNTASSCSTVESTIYVPRAGIQTASFRLLSHGRYMWYKSSMCVLLVPRNYFLHQKLIAYNIWIIEYAPWDGVLGPFIFRNNVWIWIHMYRWQIRGVPPMNVDREQFLVQPVIPSVCKSECQIVCFCG
jgi:hypothetical protein